MLSMEIARKSKNFKFPYFLMSNNVHLSAKTMPGSTKTLAGVFACSPDKADYFFLALSFVLINISSIPEFSFELIQ